MGVKIGAAMGADITVLSQTALSKEDGLKLGARILRDLGRIDLRKARRHPARPDHLHMSVAAGTPISTC